MGKVPLTADHLKTGKFVLNAESAGLSPERFFQLCRDNPELHLELTAQKEINAYVFARNVRQPGNHFNGRCLRCSFFNTGPRELSPGSDDAPSRGENAMDAHQGDQPESRLSHSRDIECVVRRRV